MPGVGLARAAHCVRPLSREMYVAIAEQIGTYMAEHGMREHLPAFGRSYRAIRDGRVAPRKSPWRARRPRNIPTSATRRSGGGLSGPSSSNGVCLYNDGAGNASIEPENPDGPCPPSDPNGGSLEAGGDNN